MSTLGWIHTIFAMIALVAGGVVLALRKGDRWHRTLGHVFLNSMLAVNFTALGIYRLYGRFGPFHWMALGSLLTLILGMIPVFTRRPRNTWLARHAALFNGSYVGLVAAFFAEITSRLPGTEDSFGLVVGITSAVVIGVGVYLIDGAMPAYLKSVPNRFRT